MQENLVLFDFFFCYFLYVLVVPSNWQVSRSWKLQFMHRKLRTILNKQEYVLCIGSRFMHAWMNLCWLWAILASTVSPWTRGDLKLFFGIETLNRESNCLCDSARQLQAWIKSELPYYDDYLDMHQLLVSIDRKIKVYTAAVDTIRKTLEISLYCLRKFRKFHRLVQSSIFRQQSTHIKRNCSLRNWWIQRSAQCITIICDASMFF